MVIHKDTQALVLNKPPGLATQGGTKTTAHVDGLLDEAETTLHRSLLLDPAQPDVVQHWVHLRQKLCRWPVLAGSIPGLDAATMLRQAGPVSALALTGSIALQGDLYMGVAA